MSRSSAYETIEKGAGLGSRTNSSATADAADADVHPVWMSPFPAATSSKFKFTARLGLTFEITTACLYRRC